MVFFLWSGFEGEGGTRRKTAWFSSLDWVQKERDKKPQGFPNDLSREEVKAVKHRFRS